MKQFGREKALLLREIQKCSGMLQGSPVTLAENVTRFGPYGWLPDLEVSDR
jgi:hypothetical protein